LVSGNYARILVGANNAWIPPGVERDAAPYRELLA